MGSVTEVKFEPLITALPERTVTLHSAAPMGMVPLVEAASIFGTGSAWAATDAISIEARMDSIFMG